MDKIAKVFFLLFLIIISCSKKSNYDKNTNNIRFVMGKYITIDLNKEKLYVNYEGLVYEDTIIFTKNEKNKIISLFSKYNLGNKMGEFWYIDENSNSASLHDEIIFLHYDRVKLHYIVNEYHDINNSLFESNENKVVIFRNLLKAIIKKKSSYKTAYDSLKVFVKRKSVWLM